MAKSERLPRTDAAEPELLRLPWDALVWFRAFCPELRQGRRLEDIAQLFGKTRQWVNKQIQLVENAVGFDVIAATTGQPVKLSERGAQLEARIDDLLRIGDAMLESRPEIVIAGIDAAVHFWLVAIMKGFLDQPANANVKITVHTCEHWEAITSVLQGVADFGFGTAWSQDERLEYLPRSVIERPHGVLVPAGHRLRTVAHVTIDSLARDAAPLISLHPTIIPWDISHLFPQRRFQGRLVHLTTCAQIVSWVRSGIGIGVVTQDMVPRDLEGHWKLLVSEGGSAIPAAKDAIFVRKDDRMPGHVQALIDAWCDHAHLLRNTFHRVARRM